MTNYNKWDKFDPDLVCREIEVQQTIDTSKRAKKKAFVEAATVNEQTVVAAKKAAEALQSQVIFWNRQFCAWLTVSLYRLGRGRCAQVERGRGSTQA